MSTIHQAMPFHVRGRKKPSASPAAAAAKDQVALPGSDCPGLSQSTHVGRVKPSEQMQVSVILKHDTELPEPGLFKSVDLQDMSKYAATPDQISSVQQFAKQHGLSVSNVDANSHTVKLAGSAKSFSKAFGVKFGKYEDAQGNQFRGYQGGVKLPQSLGGVVDGVFGLDNRPFARAHFIIAGPPGPKDSGGYNPNQVAGFYNFPKGTDGTGQTVGIIELGGGYKEDDLKAYFTRLGIKEPNVKAVSVDGAQNTPVNDPNSADGEVALDIDVVGAAAPGANIVVYFAPNTEQGFVDAVNQAAHDQANHPNALSISWGAAEKEWTPQGLTNMNQAFKDAAALGVNVFAASGDGGSSDGENDKANHADFPSSSPWAVGTGGTSITTTPEGTLSGETAWNDGIFGGSGGGGVSDVFPLPDFQKDAGVPAPTPPPTGGGTPAPAPPTRGGTPAPTPPTGGGTPAPAPPPGGRGVPDVSGDASPASGYNVQVDGQSIVVGGTSAVAPLYAALAARLGQGVGSPLGYLNPIFYQKDVKGDFNDITTGDNGGFKAGPGWDAVTGLGSPDGAKLLASLQALKPTPAPTPAPNPAPAPAPAPNPAPAPAPHLA